MILRIAFLIVLFFPLLSLSTLIESSNNSLNSIPVQDGGRIKPFDTFARERLKLIYGKDNIEGKPAAEIVFTWVLQPDLWMTKDLFEIRSGLLKKAMKLSEEKRYFSYIEITKNDRFSILMQELNSKRETKEKLDSYYQAIQNLENQLGSFNEIASGEALKLVPSQQDSTWRSLQNMSSEYQNVFVDLTKAFVANLVKQSEQSEKELNEKKLQDAVLEFKKIAKSANPEIYPLPTKIEVELQYNELHPFRWSWVFYLTGGLLALLAWILAKTPLYWTSWVLVSIGFLFNIYGFILRVYLTGRSPVSNMYETVIWVGWGAVLFAMIFEAIYKWRFILLAGSLAGAFCLILGDMAPDILDSSLHPLEPVLRSNFWLTVHVMTITISYAAFFLGFILSDIGLFLYFRGEEKNKEKIKAIVLSVYRSMQVGTSFLAPGIILGGVWADYSWGRFWGWDPKETWALIALMGYLAVLHGRLIGWIKDFGMIVTGVVAFSLVIMAWYGVNYILGAGLHSYGFGGGGVEYVAAFVVAHLLFVVFVSMTRR